MTCIILWLVHSFLTLTFLCLHFIFFSCNSHFGTRYPSSFFWEKSGLSFTPSPVTIYQKWTQYCHPISCSFSWIFRYRVYTIHSRKPSPCKIKCFYVNMTLKIWIMHRYFKYLGKHMGYIWLFKVLFILLSTISYWDAASTLIRPRVPSPYPISLCCTSPLCQFLMSYVYNGYYLL